MLWRHLSKGIETYPHVVEIRPCTVGEWRSVDKLPEAERPDAIVRLCCRIDGQPVLVPDALDIHVHSAVVAGVMANPWSGLPLTE